MGVRCGVCLPCQFCQAGWAGQVSPGLSPFFPPCTESLSPAQPPTLLHVPCYRGNGPGEALWLIWLSRGGVPRIPAAGLPRGVRGAKMFGDREVVVGFWGWRSPARRARRGCCCGVWCQLSLQSCFMPVGFRQGLLSAWGCSCRTPTGADATEHRPGRLWSPCLQSSMRLVPPLSL